jgi:hypothetical protein
MTGPSDTLLDPLDSPWNAATCLIVELTSDTIVESPLTQIGFG